MVTVSAPRGPVTSQEYERPAFAEAEMLIDERQGSLYLVDERGRRIELPETAVQLVHQVVRALARGKPVEIHALPRELTIRQAADILDLRPEDVVRLLDEGEIPFVQADEFRLIRFEDAMAYRPKRDADRRAAMDELIRLSEEMGLYEPQAPREQPRRVRSSG
jgi:hypothetical protein